MGLHKETWRKHLKCITYWKKNLGSYAEANNVAHYLLKNYKTIFCSGANTKQYGITVWCLRTFEFSTGARFWPYSNGAFFHAGYLM